jgi:hypothetical protein
MHHAVIPFNMKKIFAIINILMLFYASSMHAQQHQLQFPFIPKSWDEGMPLGNGMLGALVWQKGDAVRVSLDRADLWDERPMKGLHRPEFSYDWVHQQVLKGDYKPVQEYFDAPYDREPAPTKIPGAALEWRGMDMQAVQSTTLNLKNALCTISWVDGQQMELFVSAISSFGLFRLNAKNAASIQLVPPQYGGKATQGGDVVGGDDLTRLGYTMGIIHESAHGISYEQQGWNNFRYRVTVRWRELKNGTKEGIWSISSTSDPKGFKEHDSLQLDSELAKGYDAQFKKHESWWATYWAASAIQIPDQQLQRQYELELYKFGSAARENAPPISLQAVWTADNGRIPPWKGDYHHDLNTELSYWPAYTSNHLDAARGYLNHLQQNSDNYRKYTKNYFGVEGLNAPGVTTLKGTEMGGWIQYALSPTVSAWLSHHFYLQWKYSMDKSFLTTIAYPWVKEAATYLEKITYIDSSGHRRLPISSSPEIHNNSLKAWFLTNTNYDLALMRSCFEHAAEMAGAAGLTKEAEHWKKMEQSLEDPILSERHELMFARNNPYNESHRHFSHLMAIHPLGLIKWEDGLHQQQIIQASLKQLDSIGPSQWVGYSYAWQGNLKARAHDGDGAAKALKIFAEAFCLPNSFHVNGDQSGKGYANARYRPFTLEGNFAFASGILEMLIQSHAGYMEIMPAIPEDWKDVSFSQLRTEGAFLVDAEKQNGHLTKISVTAEKVGLMKLKLTHTKLTYAKKGIVGKPVLRNSILEADMQPGSTLEINLEY